MITILSLALAALPLVGCDNADEADDDTGTDADTDSDADTDTTPYCEANLCWQVEPTNQTKCWNDLDVIDCTSFPCESDGGPEFCGQDAQYEDTPRDFGCLDAEGAPQDPCDEAADDGETVVDSLTGLTWQRTWGTERTWQQAREYCETLAAQQYAGHSDWRLPGYHEIAGLLDFGQDQFPRIDQVAFSDTPLGRFWASSAYVAGVDKRWTVHFGDANGLVSAHKAADEYFVRCVRGEPYHGTTGAKRFLTSEAAGGDVILDQATGLSWTRRLGCWPWKNALAGCEMLERGSMDDWRLPNVKELLSLVDVGLSDPASDFPNMPASTGDPTTDSSHFWTSTSSGAENDLTRLFVVFYDGTLGIGHSEAEMTHHICVRGGM
jgi:hypothetical protein